MNLDHRPDAPALEAAAMNYARATEAELIVEGMIVKESIYYTSKSVRGVFRHKKHPAFAAWRRRVGLW